MCLDRLPFIVAEYLQILQLVFNSGMRRLQTFSSSCKIQIFDFLSDLILNCFDDYISVHDMQNIRDQVWVSESVCDEVFDDEDDDDEEKDGMQR